MTSNRSNFEFQSLTLRAIRMREALWFDIVDACAALRTFDMKSALGQLPGDEISFDTGDECPLISEPGLYQLALTLDSRVAASFRRWVERSVVPAIELDGCYVMGEERLPGNQLMAHHTDSQTGRFDDQRTVEEAAARLDWLVGCVLPAVRQDGIYVQGEQRLFEGAINLEQATMEARAAVARKFARVGIDPSRLPDLSGQTSSAMN